MSFRRNVIDPITRNLFSEMEKIKFSRVEVDVYPRGGTFKHIAEWGKSKQRVVIRSTLYVLIDYLIQIDIIKMEWFIVYLYNMRSQVTSSKF